MKIYGIILEIVKRTGGVVLPPTFYGRPGFGSFAGTLVFSEELVYQMLTELYTQLEKCGFKVIVALTGHYGPIQVNLIKKTATDYMAHSRVKVIAQPEYEGIEPPPADHAGKWETAFSMALYPELVHMKEFRPEGCDIQRYDDRWIAYDAERRDWTWKEDLRQVSSPEIGAEMIQRIADHIAGKVEGALAEVRSTV
jgi:creatinine amidohydrolase/Fe(II)-dependent formamide hydrolase-like protein